MSSIYHLDDSIYTSCNFRFKQCQILVINGGVAGLLTIPLVFIGLCNGIVLSYIILRVIPGKFRDSQLILACSLMDTLCILFDGIIMTFLPKGLPWLALKGLHFERYGQFGCKIIKYFQTFLITSRINLVFAKSFVTLYLSDFKKDRYISKNVLMYIITLFLILSVIQSIPITSVYGHWIWHDKFLCSPDPMWPKIIVDYVLIHRTIFCEGLYQSCLIMLLNLRLIFIVTKINRILKLMNPLFDYKLKVFYFLINIKIHLIRTKLNVRISLYHTTSMAVIRIIKSVLHVKMINKSYNGGYNLKPDEKCIEFLYLTSLIDLITWFELIVMVIHLWWYIIWIPEVRNWFVNVIDHLFYHNTILSELLERCLLETEKEHRIRLQTELIKTKSSFDLIYYKIIKHLAQVIPIQYMKKATKWLVKRNDLPQELIVLRAKHRTNLE